MENSIRSIMEYLCSSLAFEKITFSKCRDSHILRASVTPFARRGEAYIQIETFTDDGKALHRNFAASEAAEVLCEMAERQFRQTNIRTPMGDCEIRFSKKEQCTILNRIKPTDFVITLEIKGKGLSSEQLADKIEDLAINGKSNIVFVIGGSLGLSAAVSKRSNFKLSFSAMTFPHQMMRVVLLEQVYRSFKIIRHEAYHK